MLAVVRDSRLLKISNSMLPISLKSQSSNPLFEIQTLEDWEQNQNGSQLHYLNIYQVNDRDTNYQLMCTAIIRSKRDN